jgi:hypothetical protein
LLDAPVAPMNIPWPPEPVELEALLLPPPPGDPEPAFNSVPNDVAPDGLPPVPPSVVSAVIAAAPVPLVATTTDALDGAAENGMM